MKLGISFTPRHETPDEWAASLEALGCRAAVCPIAAGADEDTNAADREAAARHHIDIAEVGVWNSPIADDAQMREKALAFAKGQLRLADQIGAACCVNVAGSTGPNWSFGCKKDRTAEGYQRIVASVQEISTMCARSTRITRLNVCRSCRRPRRMNICACLQT